VNADHLLIGALMGAMNAEARGDQETARAFHDTSVAIDRMMHGSTFEQAVDEMGKQKQAQMARAERIPRRCNLKPEQLEALGFVLGEDTGDRLFISATLPPGWEIRSSDHYMWSYVHDERGRCRASLFYKPDFWDQDAHISFSPRYSVSVEPVGGWKEPVKPRQDIGYVKDEKQVIFATSPTDPEPGWKGGESEEKRQLQLAWYAQKDQKGDEARAWLNERYPEWMNPLAYWE
jgi:hypothetical protein